MPCRTFYVVAVLCATGAHAGVVVAQHHYHTAGHRGGIGSHHSGIHYGHRDWTYVVPHRDAHRGGYYVQGSDYYYTPTRIAPLQSASIAPVHVAPPVRMEFGGFSRHEDLSGRLAAEANQFCLDMHYNYRHNPGFRETYSEAYQLLQAAKYIHDADHAGDRDEVRRRVVEMDQLFHHVREELAGWSRDHHRQVGSGDVIEKASSVEAVLHHLCYDVGVEPHEELGEQAPPAEELAPPPG